MQRLSGLDAQRGIAAIIVALAHALLIDGQHVRFAGYLSVDYFFLLSGFVLAAAFEPRFDEIGITQFYVLRFKRFWPLIMLGSALGAGFEYALGGSAWIVGLELAFAAALIPYRNGLFELNRPGWSIFFELLLNVFHVALFRHLRVRWLLALSAAGAMCMIAFAPSMDTGQGRLFELGVPRAVMGYCLGIALFRLRGARPLGPAWLGLAGVPLIVVLGTLLPERLEILALLPAPLVLLAGVGLRGRVFEWLGALSFPLYAIHYPVMKILNLLGLGWGFTLAGSLVATFAVMQLAQVGPKLGALSARASVRA